MVEIRSDKGKHLQFKPFGENLFTHTLITLGERGEPLVFFLKPPTDLDGKFWPDKSLAKSNFRLFHISFLYLAPFRHETVPLESS